MTKIFRKRRKRKYYYDYTNFIKYWDWPEVSVRCDWNLFFQYRSNKHANERTKMYDKIINTCTLVVLAGQQKVICKGVKLIAFCDGRDQKVLTMKI